MEISLQNVLLNQTLWMIETSNGIVISREKGDPNIHIIGLYVLHKMSTHKLEYVCDKE